jgi:hypothetical protein
METGLLREVEAVPQQTCRLKDNEPSKKVLQSGTRPELLLAKCHFFHKNRSG